MFNLSFRKFSVGLGVLLILFFASNCFCESQARDEPSERRHHIGFGPDFLFYRWDKKIRAIKSKGSQLFGGSRVRYEYSSSDLFYLGFDLASFRVLKSYKICNNDQPPDDSYDAERELDHLDLRLGYTFSNRSCDYLISPFLGGGIYHFGRDQCCHHHTISDKDSFAYLSGGVNLKCRLTNRLDLGCRLKAFYVFSEEIRFKFQDKQVKEEKKLYGGECSVPIVWHMSKTDRCDVGLEPYVLALGLAGEQLAFGTKLLFTFNF